MENDYKFFVIMYDNILCSSDIGIIDPKIIQIINLLCEEFILVCNGWFLKNGVESKMNVWENLNRQIDRQISMRCSTIVSYSTQIYNMIEDRIFNWIYGHISDFEYCYFCT